MVPVKGIASLRVDQLHARGLVYASELAEELGVPVSTVMGLARYGRIPFVLEFCPRQRRRLMMFSRTDATTAFLALSTHRRCTRCGHDKPVSKFKVRNGRPDGVCRACYRLRQRALLQGDPVYRSQIEARMVRRRRAIAGTQVEPINRELVAARDGWRCCICGGQVTRDNWSLDHVLPLSKGGSHTYGNVALAHRDCNIRRGVGRLPSQAPLFAVL